MNQMTYLGLAPKLKSNCRAKSQFLNFVWFIRPLIIPYAIAFAGFLDRATHEEFRFVAYGDASPLIESVS